MKHKITVYVWSLTLVLEAIAYWFYTQIQGNEIILHWNMEGEADGYGQKWMLFVLVLTIPMVDTVLLLFRKIDPKRKNYDKFHASFQAVRLLMACFSSAFCLFTFYAQQDPQSFDIGTISSVLCAILFIFLGNMMPKMRRNFMMGIRTPWTITNETVWIKTHRLGGRIWFFSGFVLMLVAFLPPPYHMVLFFGIIALMVLIPTVYSYMFYHHLKRKGDQL